MNEMISSVNTLNFDYLVNNSLKLQLTDIPQNLQNILLENNNATLRISLQNNTLLTQIEIDNNVFDIKLTGQLPKLENNSTIEIPIKINIPQSQIDTSNKPQTSNSPQVNNISNSAKIDINDIKTIFKSISLTNLKIDDAISYKLQSLNLPISTTEKIIQQIPQLQISLSSLGEEQKNTSSPSLLNSVYKTLEQLAQADTKIDNIIPQLKQDLQNLIGQKISGEVSQHNNNITRIKTNLGDTFFSEPIKLSLHQPITLEIVNLAHIPMPTNHINLQSNLVTNLINIFLNETTSGNSNTDIHTQLMSQLSNLKNVSSNYQIVNILADKIPTINQNFLVNIVNFYQAVDKKDISIWMGKDNIKQLITQTDKPEAIITELNNIIQSSVKETPLWKITEIPFFAGEQIVPLKIALKKQKQEESSQDNNSNEERFVVETEFSILGSFQFDGFVQTCKRHVDLIIRTSRQFDNDFCANIINLFKNSLYNLNYTGNIKINQKDNFINFYQDYPPSQGIYI